jgi:hypothetical protein
MRAVLVVVANILREEAFQVAFVNCDDAIQQITTTAAYLVAATPFCQGLRNEVRTHLIFIERIAAGDRSLGEIKTEHEKLAMDARRAPGWILNNHPEDQLPNLLRRLFSPNLRPDFGNQSPIRAETCSVPPDDSFGRNDDEGLFPL